MTVGDFDSDGYDDVAVGAPGDTVGPFPGAGSVHIIHGSPSGLTASGNEIFSQDTIEVEDGAEANDRLATAVVAGDFNCDNIADLAIGVPGKSIGSSRSAGAVNVLYGSSAGLSTSGHQVWHQDSSGIKDSSEVGDLFGAYLSTGNLNGDSSLENDCYDLVIGVPHESVGPVPLAGAVNVIYGGTSGLSSTGNELFHQDVTGIEGNADAGDMFGVRIQAYDVDLDGDDDLQIQIPGESSHGSYAIIFQTSSGLDPGSDTLTDHLGGPDPFWYELCVWSCEVAWQSVGPPPCSCEEACSWLKTDDPCPGCA